MISIIIVSWNAGQQIIDCVISIKQYHQNLVEKVVIVDNASTDGSIATLEALKELPFKFEIIKNSSNRGFAAACNQGAAIVSANYLLFLNPDTLLFKNSLLVPYQFMSNQKNSRIGICGIQLIDESEQISRSCARFPTLLSFVLHATALIKIKCLHRYNMHMSDWNHNSTQIVDHVIGAFFLVHKDLFEQLGGFDESYFVYLEDLDFSLRMKQQLGLSCVYLTDAQAFHRGGGTSSQVKAHRLFYSLRSRIFYAFKHFSVAKAWLVMGTTLLIEPITRSLLTLVKFNITDFKNVWNGYRMLFSDIPNWFKKLQ